MMKSKTTREMTRKQNDYWVITSWFMELDESDLPVPPFALKPGITVTGPLFYKRLREDIHLGPNSARNKYGALVDDLVYLKLLIGEKHVAKEETGTDNQ